MFSGRFRNPRKSLCPGNELSVWVMCCRLGKLRIAPSQLRAAAGASCTPQAALGTEVAFYTA